MKTGSKDQKQKQKLDHKQKNVSQNGKGPAMQTDDAWQVLFRAHISFGL